MKNEKLTRKEIIDNRLKQAGWNVTDHTHVIQEFDIIVAANLVQEAQTPYSGHQFSDYVLLGKNGKPLAVVEAKKHRSMLLLEENKPNNVTILRLINMKNVHFVFMYDNYSDKLKAIYSKQEWVQKLIDDAKKSPLANGNFIKAEYLDACMEVWQYKAYN